MSIIILLSQYNFCQFLLETAKRRGVPSSTARVFCLRIERTSTLRVITLRVEETSSLRVSLRTEEIYTLQFIFVKETPFTRIVIEHPENIVLVPHFLDL